MCCFPQLCTAYTTSQALLATPLGLCSSLVPHGIRSEPCTAELGPALPPAGLCVPSLGPRLHPCTDLTIWLAGLLLVQKFGSKGVAIAATAPLLPDFQTCGHPCGTHGMALWAGSGLWVQGEHLCPRESQSRGSGTVKFREVSVQTRARSQGIRSRRVRRPRSIRAQTVTLARTTGQRGH